jgi:5-methylcytosine-specific restriction protein B
MKTWLISWAPDYSNLPEPFGRWPQSKQIIENVNNGQKYTENWRFSSTQVEVGDRVFLIKIGKIDKKQKGIIASGVAKSLNYVREDGARSVDIEFDRIIDHFTHDILQIDLLEREYSNQTWSSQSSGIEIREEYVERLVNEWDNFVPTMKPFYEELVRATELNPNEHDGSYELVQEVVGAYSRLETFNNVNFNDLNLIYLMTIISESRNRDKKLALVDSSNLKEEDKLIVKAKINEVFDKAANREYENRSGDRDTVGMFGTGFYSFRTKTDNESAQKFIKLCVDISNLTDENEMLEIAKEALKDGVRGMGSASASQVLHCLKPFVFPIVNKGNGPKVYNEFGIKFDRYMEVKNYMPYAYQIKEIRDDYFAFKNYRIFDIVGERTRDNTIRIKPTNINFLNVLRHIEDNHNKPYEKPDRITDPVRRAEIENLRSEAQGAVNEIKKVTAVCSHDYGLSKITPTQWLDGSNTKIRDYLWVQMRYPDTTELESISLFTEIINGKARFRVALELKNDRASDADYDRHHKSLELPLDEEAGLVYVSGSNEFEIGQEFTDRNLAISNVANGTFRKVQISKIIDYDETTTNDELDDAVFSGIEAILPYYEHVLGENEVIQTDEVIEENVNEGVTLMKKIIEKNLILYGPPGTGKTYNSKNYAVAICENKSVEDVMLEEYSEVLQRYDNYVDEGRIAFTTFHQSYGYEEFIEGIYPEVNESDQVTYKTKDGVFKAFCRESENYDEARVFIVDEINRGNISKIFGELITLIEDTKREGSSEAMNVMLPYSKETFSVPKNVYILGTMNTADRSIALMDTALRRRFAFEEMMPETKLLKDLSVDGLNIQAMVETINRRIEVLYDREHTIGHAYFMVDDLNIDKLAHIFKNKIIPLLQEYFYEDYEKIQWVLGDNDKTDESIKFIKKIKNERTIFKGNTDIDMNIIPEFRYEINDKAFIKIDSYKQII